MKTPAEIHVRSWRGPAPRHAALRVLAGEHEAGKDDLRRLLGGADKQLYLSLRLALAGEFAREHQVLLFTCHPATAELLSAAGGTVSVVPVGGQETCTFR